MTPNEFQLYLDSFLSENPSLNIYKSKIEYLFSAIHTIPNTGVYCELNLDPALYLTVRLNESTLIHLSIPLEAKWDNNVVFSYYKEKKYIHGGLMPFDKFMEGALKL